MTVRLKFTLKMVIWLLVLFGGYLVNAELCQTDDDCARPNMYCYSTGVCANCTNCSVYQRYPGNLCAKNKEQCGDCFTGMVAHINIDGTKSICHPMVVTPTPEDQILPEGLSNTSCYIIVGAVFILIIISYIIFRLTRHKCPEYGQRLVQTFGPLWPTGLMNNRSCDLSYSKNNNSATAPPLDFATGPPNPPEYSQIYRPVENEESQTANPFANPNYARNRSFPNYSEDPEENTTENDTLILPNTNTVDNATVVNLPENEETLPSSWTPVENTGTPQQLSFENAIQNLQRLEISQPDSTIASTSATRSSQEQQSSSNSQGTSSENQNFQNSNSTQININLGLNINNTNAVFQGRFN